MPFGLPTRGGFPFIPQTRPFPLTEGGGNIRKRVHSARLFGCKYPRDVLRSLPPLWRGRFVLYRIRKC